MSRAGLFSLRGRPGGPGKRAPAEASDRRRASLLDDLDKRATWRRIQTGTSRRSKSWAEFGRAVLQVARSSAETDVPCAIGYERVEVGPTTNFVGNHMTQGAIDLVQAELETPSAADAAARPLSITGPQPLRVQKLASPLRRLPQAVERYGWYDCGASVKVEIPLETPDVQATCHFTSASVAVQIQDAEGRSHALELRPLTAEIQAECCEWFVRGRKLFVVLAKRRPTQWQSLCRVATQPAPKKARANAEQLRRQFLLRAEASNAEGELQPIRPLKKVVRRVTDGELALVRELVCLGERRYRAGDYLEALDAFNRATKDIADLANPSRRGDPLTSRTEETAAAVRASALFVMSAELHHRMGECRVQTGQLKTAVELCSISLEELCLARTNDGGLRTDVLLTRAKALESLEDYRASHCDYQEVLKLGRTRAALDGVRRVSRILVSH